MVRNWLRVIKLTFISDKSKPLKIRCNLRTTTSTRDLRSNRIFRWIARETCEFDIIKTFSKGSRFSPLITPGRTSNKILMYVLTDGFAESSPTRITSCRCTCSARTSVSECSERAKEEKKMKAIKDLYINNAERIPVSMRREKICTVARCIDEKLLARNLFLTRWFSLDPICGQNFIRIYHGRDLRKEEKNVRVMYVWCKYMYV